MKLNIFNDYVTEVANLYNIEEEKIFEKSKERGIVDARHLLYYLCYYRPMKLKYIQDYMGQRGYEIGHSSIIHGIQSVHKAMAEDDDYQKVINEINGK
jgi:chromosomal replication initiation ATPase DnaA|tara:strand:- start:312 stop:605 length:294 start_codon:yes stop_codon:yes gene_type:complete